MKRALKGLFRKGEANVVKIICLSVGLAIGLVMLAEVIFERSYDNFLPGLKDTYRVEERYKQKGTDWREYSQTPGAIGPGLQHYCPAVEVATRFTGIGSMTLTTEDRQELNGQAYFAIVPFPCLSSETADGRGTLYGVGKGQQCLYLFQTARGGRRTDYRENIVVETISRVSCDRSRGV